MTPKNYGLAETLDSVLKIFLGAQKNSFIEIVLLNAHALIEK